MSIDRGDRIILMMIRSLCCCSQRTKVGDSSDEIIAKQLLKNVFIVCTQNVLTRALTGKLIASLEDRHLIPVHLKLIRPTQEVIDKSNVLKDERRRQLSDAWMLLVFRGREAQSRVTECIKQFKQQYSLHKRMSVIGSQMGQNKKKTFSVLMEVEGNWHRGGIDKECTACQISKMQPRRVAFLIVSTVAFCQGTLNV
uniref:Uncharacterized protein n=1 Tax=Caenorhabditis japonica TaxID=281687 RepID=A0A8R1HJ34_CAEJA